MLETMLKAFEFCLPTKSTAVPNGPDLRGLPLSMRKANLQRLLARRPDGIFLSDFEQGEIGPALFRKACLEGLVSKRSDRPYRGVARRTGSRSRTGGIKRSIGCRKLTAVDRKGGVAIKAKRGTTMCSPAPSRPPPIGQYCRFTRLAASSLSGTEDTVAVGRGSLRSRPGHASPFGPWACISPLLGGPSIAKEFWAALPATSNCPAHLTEAVADTRCV